MLLNLPTHYSHTQRANLLENIKGKNMTNFKMNFYRNSQGALVADIYADGERVFASSKGYQIGCAFEAMGAAGFTYEHNAGSSYIEFGGVGVLQGIPEINRDAIDQRVFWAEVGVSFMIHGHHGRDNDPDFATVCGHLPAHLVADSGAGLRKV